MPTSDDRFERRHNVMRARREWSAVEKQAIVAETRLPGANISAISRRYGVAQSLIYQWRKVFSSIDGTPASSTPVFLPVAMAAPMPDVPAPVASARAAAEPGNSGTIEIVLANGRRVRTDAGTDPAQLARIIAALDGAV